MEGAVSSKTEVSAPDPSTVQPSHFIFDGEFAFGGRLQK